MDAGTQAALQAEKNAETADAATQLAADPDSPAAAEDAALANFDQAIAGEQGTKLT